MHPLEEEKKVGITEFYTKKSGIGGKLRFIPEDFRVVEIPKELPKSADGDFVIVSVTAKNWETNRLIHEIAKNLRISRKRIGFAGTKDKRALTTQLFSIYYPKEDLPALNIRDVLITPLYRSDKRLEIGDLKGNRFEIVIRCIEGEKKKVEQQMQSLATTLLSLGGFPNFYGIQRFGVVRPITHLIGRHIIKGEFEKAVNLYLTYSTDEENELDRKAREVFAHERDISNALNVFPSHLLFERSLLNALAKKPNDYVAALQTLPKNLLMMFVFAYQSYIFNKILSERIKKGLPLNSAVVGDLIVPVTREGEYEKPIPVTSGNIEKVNYAIGRGKAAVTGAVVGYDAMLAKGVMGEIEHAVIEDEKIDVREFIIPELPFLSSSGGRRTLLAPFTGFKWVCRVDDLNAGKLAVYLSFTLKKGCYATSLLREFMKADKITAY